jgi:hypothetical protein
MSNEPIQRYGPATFYWYYWFFQELDKELAIGNTENSNRCNLILILFLFLKKSIEKYNTSDIYKDIYKDIYTFIRKNKRWYFLIIIDME